MPFENRAGVGETGKGDMNMMPGNGGVENYDSSEKLKNWSERKGGGVVEGILGVMSQSKMEKNKEIGGKRA